MKIETPSESGHWYKLDGTPCYEVEAKKGGMRATTLRDARKLNLVPSVTTITKILDRPGLANWIQEQAIVSAITMPRLAGESDESLISRIKAESKERGIKAAERGTALHTDIERAIQGKPHGHEMHVAAVADAMKKAGLDLFDGFAEKSFAHTDGFGGKIDWQRDNVIVDFKSKDRIDDDKRLAWDEHSIQLAAYAHGLEIESPRLLNIFVGIVDGRVVVVEHAQEEAAKGLAMFRLMLKIWQLKNEYKPL
jgi:hypothetical protein